MPAIPSRASSTTQPGAPAGTLSSGRSQAGAAAAPAITRAAQSVRSKPAVPTYDLYGEGDGAAQDIWLHCETIESRSRTYRWEIGRHRHEALQQILYIRGGTGDAILGDTVTPLAPPCVVLVPPGLTHGFRFSHDMDGLVLTFSAPGRAAHTSDGYPEAMAAFPAAVVPLGDCGERPFLDQLFVRLADERPYRHSGARRLARSCLDAAIVILNRMVADREPQDVASRAQETVARLEDLIDENLHRQMTIAAYAALLGLSPTHLNRCVRAVTGSSAHRLVMMRVMEEAKRLLVFGRGSVQDVSAELGFSDSAYFCRRFRQLTGETPGAHRLRMRET